MGKKDSTVARIVAPKEWELKRAQERITYPPGYAGPIQMDWRVRETYSAKDLDYRGRTKTSDARSGLQCPRGGDEALRRLAPGHTGWWPFCLAGKPA
jgi:hypothetical protein